MDIVYLDQNKWIELAGVHAGRVRSGPVADLYPQLVAAVNAGQVLFPLSASHVLETSKRNDPGSRIDVAETQAKLSRGYVYRSRSVRLEIEVCSAILRLFQAELPDLPPHWAIGAGFLHAFEPMDMQVAAAGQSEALARFNALMDPAEQYVSYMKDQDDDHRRAAHVAVAAGAIELVARIEERRTRLTGQSVDMRRRAYAVQQFIDHQHLFVRILDQLGYTFDQLRELGDRAVRALTEDVPTLNVEAEMAARLEAKVGALKPNDVFDMQAFYTAIPYSSHIVAERSAISMARQARLHIRYPVRLSTSLNELIGGRAA